MQSKRVIDSIPTYSTETKELKDLFGKVGDKYATFRPTYPQELFDIINDITKDTPQELAIDVGCGNGQATIELGKLFKSVIGVDPSLSQISNAKKADNIQYKQSPAECIDQPPNTADLITVAQAVHWFDLPKFFEESKRILKPNGYLIIWCYGSAICFNEEAQRLHQDFYHNILGDKYLLPNLRYIDRRYIDIIPPFENTTRKSISFQKTISIVNMIGYYSTWSGYITYLTENEDYLPTLKKRLMDAFKTDDENFEITIEFPIDIIISKMN
ncbi:putative SAM dependent methyltransferase [Heterostelium album PN500]|uniref:Putative SAM dependent methyltransferase n=1 Tax=Heterostelium pallidum (strain ATCC 26659 / Pp 5 / PN500) TaxID=670386 RepID=D3BVD6_HETP5|nr:putative SAM dependent methyltransferase [Heterostelium album PN500]EFA74693.1 putative SAM dependent methyltransferase [Heterostelium album PN500]|eukprot:XP_020426827.1 putative SAM dependent methyltransferase [Heterostelium album PN500]